MGTPVASGWDERGFYPNNKTGQHSGIFAGPIFDRNGTAIGFKIVEQYSTLTTIQQRNVYFDAAPKDTSKNYFHKAGSYAIIRY